MAHTIRLELQHITTDPACQHHRPPRGLISRWRFERARGRGCPACLSAEIADALRDWVAGRPELVEVDVSSHRPDCLSPRRPCICDLYPPSL